MSTDRKTIKLQLFLARAGIASRRKSEVLISSGEVFVNGQKATIGQRVNPTVDAVTIKGKKITTPQSHRYFLVNKPAGFVSTTADEKGRKTVLDLVPDTKERLYPVGRLDKESEGLMLLTNNGELAYKLTHPKFEIPKTYEVLITGFPTRKALDHLARGVKLKEGFTKPAEVAVLQKTEEGTWLEITISEGRNHQIRRMTERVGYETLKLVRTQMGPFDIGDLEEKVFLELSEEQVALLFE